MLIPDFQITQQQCDALIFKDVTSPYSVDYPGGYGGLNVDADRIVKTKVSLDLGINGYYSFERTVNQTNGEWVINAYDIPYVPVSSGCSDCGVPCDCEGCSDVPDLDPNCGGFLSGFPEGCITVKMEVFSAGETDNTFVLEGTKIKRIISTCYQDKKLLDIADKLTLGDDCRYSFHKTKEKRLDAMRDLMFAWTKLKLLAEVGSNCDCECVASSVKQIKVYLDGIKL